MNDPQDPVIKTANEPMGKIKNFVIFFPMRKTRKRQEIQHFYFC